MEPAHFLLIRHGKTAGNENGGTHLVGSTDLPLTVQGYRQARRLASRLRTWPFRVIYSSPLQRAAATAREIAAVRRVPLVWCRGLQEIDCGRVDGLDVETVRRCCPASWEANRRQDDDAFRWPGGESYRELRRRSLAACDRIAVEHPGELVVVVTHSGVVNQVIGSLAGLGAAQWEPYRPGHCTLTHVEWQQGAGRLMEFDQQARPAAPEPRSALPAGLS